MNINSASQMRFMRSYSPTEARGLNVSLKRTNNRHLGHTQVQPSGDNTVKSFKNLLINVFNNVNQAQVNALNLQKMQITNPEKVNAHQVTIAMTKAETSLEFLKAMNSRIVTGFKELTNLR